MDLKRQIEQLKTMSYDDLMEHARVYTDTLVEQISSIYSDKKTQRLMFNEIYTTFFLLDGPMTQKQYDLIKLFFNYVEIEIHSKE